MVILRPAEVVFHTPDQIWGITGLKFYVFVPAIKTSVINCPDTQIHLWGFEIIKTHSHFKYRKWSLRLIIRLGASFRSSLIRSLNFWNLTLTIAKEHWLQVENGPNHESLILSLVKQVFKGSLQNERMLFELMYHFFFQFEIVLVTQRWRFKNYFRGRH